MNRHPLTMAFDKHDYRVVEYRPNLFDELAAENAQRETVEYYERLARQAQRKVKAQRIVKAFCIAVAVFAVVYFGGRELIGLVR